MQRWDQVASEANLEYQVDLHWLIYLNLLVSRTYQEFFLQVFQVSNQMGLILLLFPQKLQPSVGHFPSYAVKTGWFGFGFLKIFYGFPRSVYAIFA